MARVVLCAAVLGVAAMCSLAMPAAGSAHVKYVLRAGQIGRVDFGQPRRMVVRRLDVLMGRGPNARYHVVHGCGVDRVVGWPSLAAFFSRGVFVGYSYRAANGAGRIPTLATPKGLRVGDTLGKARRLYGFSFHASHRHGGSWWVRTPQGLLGGVASGLPGGPRRSVATIAAGHMGCQPRSS